MISCLPLFAIACRNTSCCSHSILSLILSGISRESQQDPSSLEPYKLASSPGPAVLSGLIAIMSKEGMLSLHLSLSSVRLSPPMEQRFRTPYSIPAVAAFFPRCEPRTPDRPRASSLADRPLARPSADGRRGFAARSEARQTSREQDPRRKRRKKVPDKRRKKKSRKWRGVKTSLRNIYHLPGRKNKVKFLGREKKDRAASSYQSSGGVISLS